MVKWSQNIVLEFINELKSPKVMSYPDISKPFVVHCDASEKGLGVALYQKIEGIMNVISYESRTLTPAENYYYLQSGKLEFLALEWSVTERLWKHVIQTAIHYLKF